MPDPPTVDEVPEPVTSDEAGEVDDEPVVLASFRMRIGDQLLEIERRPDGFWKRLADDGIPFEVVDGRALYPREPVERWLEARQHRRLTLLWISAHTGIPLEDLRAAVQAGHLEAESLDRPVRLVPLLRYLARRA